MKEKILNIYYHILARLARFYVKKHKPFVIWVCGSVGKTSCRMIVSQILQAGLKGKKIVTSEKNFNGELWLSLSIFQIEKFEPTVWCLIQTYCKIRLKTFFGKKPYDVIFLEYGIDHPWEMNFLLSIVKPEIWIFTSIDKVHSLQFGDPDVIAREEALLIKNTKEIAFINMSDQYGRQLMDKLDIDIFRYHTEETSDETDIHYVHNQLIKNHDHISSKATLFIKKQKITVETNLIGKENLWYIWVWLCIKDILAHRFSISLPKSSDTVKITITLQPWRFTLFKGLRDSILIDSSYNAAPMSMRKVLDSVYAIKKECLKSHKIIACLGDMRELGDFEEQEHRLLAWPVSQIADVVVAVGTNSVNHFSDELRKIWYPSEQIFPYLSSVLAGEKIKEIIKENSHQNYIVVFKWSQNTIFLEEAVKVNLADSEKRKKLPRQSKRWLSTKKKFFETMHQFSAF